MRLYLFIVLDKPCAQLVWVLLKIDEMVLLPNSVSSSNSSMFLQFCNLIVPEWHCGIVVESMLRNQLSITRSFSPVQKRRSATSSY